VVLKKSLRESTIESLAPNEGKNDKAKANILSFEKTNIDDLEQISDKLYNIRNTPILIEPSLLQTKAIVVLSVNDVDGKTLAHLTDRIPVNFAITQTRIEGEYGSYIVLTLEGKLTRSSVERAASTLLSCANLLTLEGARIITPQELKNISILLGVGK